MDDLFVGRKEESKILKETLTSPEAEMVAVVGRRRVGKTYLINTIYQEKMIFQLTGIQNADTEAQLFNFTKRLKKFAQDDMPDIKTPKTWYEAFSLLEDYLEIQLKDGEKKVIFIDEIPWMAGTKSNFLSAFGYFWNSWASQQNIVIVICGSATSWIVQKVVFDTGGLHNRITKYIHLEPFTLAETEEYLKRRYLPFNRYQIVELYMAMGGIPHYLKEVQRGKSAVQNIDTICFSKTGLLRNEFQKLYPALFRFPENHIAIVKALATKRKGMTLEEVIKAAKTPSGGVTTKTLEELEQSGFILSFHALNKKEKEKLFRLTDEYSLFYLHFMQDKTNEGEGTWQYLSQTPTYKTWSGYAFEGICLKHVKQIKKGLGISGVYTKTASFYNKGTQEEPGVQIDLLIDRNDNIINIVEVKFYNKEFVLTKEGAEKLRRRKWAFEEISKTKKLTTIAMLTTFGVKQNQHSLELIQNNLTLDDLFEIA